MELDKFEEFLSQGNMAKNTISAYLYDSIGESVPL